jgi:hypothetical protein
MITIPNSCAVALTAAGTSPEELAVPAGHLADLLGPASHTQVRTVGAGDTAVGFDTVLEMFSDSSTDWWHTTLEAAVRGGWQLTLHGLEDEPYLVWALLDADGQLSVTLDPEGLWFYNLGEYAPEYTPDRLLNTPGVTAAWIAEWSGTTGL